MTSSFCSSCIVLKLAQARQRNYNDPTGSFTRKEEENNYMPFFDAKLTRKDDGSVKSTVYRKKTHTGQCRNFT